MNKIALMFFIFLIFTSAQVFGQTEKLLANSIEKEKTNDIAEFIKNNNSKASALNIEEVKPVKLKLSMQDLQNVNTGINYFIKKDGFVTLKIFDDAGNEIASLINRRQKPGAYFVNYSTINLKKGIYTYKLSINDVEQTPKLLLVQ